jgi:hypothetical protein
MLRQDGRAGLRRQSALVEVVSSFAFLAFVVLRGLV